MSSCTALTKYWLKVKHLATHPREWLTSANLMKAAYWVVVRIYGLMLIFFMLAIWKLVGTLPSFPAHHRPRPVRSCELVVVCGCALGTASAARCCRLLRRGVLTNRVGVHVADPAQTSGWAWWLAWLNGSAALITTGVIIGIVQVRPICRLPRRCVATQSLMFVRGALTVCCGGRRCNVR